MTAKVEEIVIQLGDLSVEELLSVEVEIKRQLSTMNRIEHTFSKEADSDYEISAEELAELKADIASAEAQKLAGVLLTVEDIKRSIAEVLAEKAANKNKNPAIA